MRIRIRTVADMNSPLPHLKTTMQLEQVWAAKEEETDDQ